MREDEAEELERERRVISSSEQLKSLSYGAFQSLRGEEDSHNANSALGKLNDAAHIMKNIVELDPALKQQMDYLEETMYGLEEVARDISHYHERVEFDPGRLEEIESRLELIRNLQRKYGQTITEVLDYSSKAEAELEGLSSYSERRARLEEAHTQLLKEMGYMASELSKARSKAAEQLKTEVKKELDDLK